LGRLQDADGDARIAEPIPRDAEMYQWRHLIENFFCKLKEFKRIAHESLQNRSEPT
jgi:transposase